MPIPKRLSELEAMVRMCFACGDAVMVWLQLGMLIPFGRRVQVSV